MIQAPSMKHLKRNTFLELRYVVYECGVLYGGAYVSMAACLLRERVVGIEVGVIVKSWSYVGV